MSRCLLAMMFFMASHASLFMGPDLQLCGSHQVTDASSIHILLLVKQRLGDSLDQLKDCILADSSPCLLAGVTCSPIMLSGNVSTTVTCLDLIGYIPDEVGLLSDLQSLDLRKNGLTGYLPGPFLNRCRLPPSSVDAGRDVEDCLYASYAVSSVSLDFSNRSSAIMNRIHVTGTSGIVKGEIAHIKNLHTQLCPQDPFLRRLVIQIKEIIPQFYFPYGPPAPKDVQQEVVKKIEQLFSAHPDGLPIAAFIHVTKEVCKLPSFFSSSLFKRIDIGGKGLILKYVQNIGIAVRSLFLELRSQIENSRMR